MGLIPHNVHTAVSVSTGQASATVNAFLAKYRSTTLTIPFKTVESAPPSFFGKAAGGRIYGPGTETSDSIPVRLSRNEHVV